jgi:CRP-like cAMP-binding protein
MQTVNKIDALAMYRKKMESFSPIPDDEFDQIAEKLHEKHFTKGEVILKEGQVCKEFYFIISGCIRSFSLEQGREVNVKFFFENDTACEFTSFRSEEPSSFYMIVMEDTDVFCGVKTEIVPVFAQEVSLHMLLFRFFQDLYFREEEHSNSFKLLTPEERYNYLIEHTPQYLTRIPLVHLASYLGISRETLTRIRQRQG